MVTEELFVLIGDISDYQCCLFPFNYNTLKSSLDGIDLIYLLFNKISSIISVFASLTLYPPSTSLFFKYYVLQFIVFLNIDMHIPTVVIFSLYIYI